MKKLNLNENFICRIWENPDYYSNLKTDDGQEITILDFGVRNKDSGPDYFDAKILLDGKVKSGKIEIHQTNSDWSLHKHQSDKKYDDVILNVSLWDSGLNPEVKNSSGESIPQIILSRFLVSSINEIWREIIENPSQSFKLPCFPDIATVNPVTKRDWIVELSKRRLNKKMNRMTKSISDIPAKSEKSKWEQVLFLYLCESLGYSKNKKQMLKLAQSFNTGNYNVKNPVECEALLFKLSGLLKKNSGETYSDELEEISSKYKISTTMNYSEWNFFRLRPSNFPVLRIAYASSILYEIVSNDLFKNIISIFENSTQIRKEILKLFSSINTPEYWKVNYNFGKRKSRKTDLIGKQRLDDILTNVLVPFVYHYSNCFEKTRLGENCLKLYFESKVKSTNEITRAMELQTGFKMVSFADEQGLIELHNEYCIEGKCSYCDIGKELAPDIVAEPLTIIMY